MTRKQKAKGALELRLKRLERMVGRIEHVLASDREVVIRAERAIRVAISRDSELAQELVVLRDHLRQRITQVEGKLNRGFQWQRYRTFIAWAALVLWLVIPATVEALSR